jgi:hypothetical protein
LLAEGRIERLCLRKEIRPFLLHGRPLVARVILRVRQSLGVGGKLRQPPMNAISLLEILVALAGTATRRLEARQELLVVGSGLGR